MRYLDAIELLSKYLGIPYLKVVELEKCSDYLNTRGFDLLYSYGMKTMFDNVKEGDQLTGEDMRHISQLVLRENLWCKLEYSTQLKVHFGYDYYMYFVSASNCDSIISMISSLGLFVEQCASPYL
jgi:hypothetical protein